MQNGVGLIRRQMAKQIDITGQMFGFYRAESYIGDEYWLCTCTKCGKQKPVKSYNLRRTGSKSCTQCAIRKLPIHGHSKRIGGRESSRTYAAWLSMKARCLYPSTKGYKWYGGRGIKVCERWLKSFELFLEDMGEVPPGMWLDRKDSDGDYEPGNCRWATASEQRSNQKRNRFVLCYGEKMTCKSAAIKIGFKQAALNHYLSKHPEFDSDVSRLAAIPYGTRTRICLL